MIYNDFSKIVQRITEVKEFKVQAIIISIGIFLSLFTAAFFGGNLWLIIAAVSFVILGVLVLLSKRSLVNISENGPMEEVDGIKAIRWGIFYVFFGTLLSVFYFLI